MKQRVITALILVLICVPLIIAGNIPYYIFISIIGMMGFHELIKLIDKDNHLPYLMKGISYGLLLLFILNNVFTTPEAFVIDYRILALLVFLLIMPIIFYDKKKYNINDALFLLSSVVFLGIAFNCFITVRNIGLGYLLFLLVIPIITDSFAYFTGMLIGKHKMAPSISPKKTWEGFAGGLAFGTFVSCAIYLVSFSYEGSVLIPIFIIALLSVVGQLGDLVFSSIKRYYDVKDYSNLLPGHGGILDRVDSMLFVLLTFSLISSFLI